MPQTAPLIFPRTGNGGIHFRQIRRQRFSQITLILWLRKSCVWEKCGNSGWQYTPRQWHRFPPSLPRGKQMLDRKIIGEVLGLFKVREYTAVNLYLPLSWAASTNGE